METAIQTQLSSDPTAIYAFIGYLILIVGIGIYATRFSSAGVCEFFIGGRKMNRFVVALSAVVSGRSSWLLLGVTGMAYKKGASAVWAVVGYIVMEVFLFIFFAKKLRRFSEKYNCITVPDFFAARFGDKNGLLRILISFVIIIFMVSYVSAQFVGGGKTFAASFHMSHTTGVLLTAVIVLVYTMMGGFLGVCLTDVLQGFFMIFGLVLLPIVIIANKGGLGIILTQLQAVDVSMIDPFSLSIGAGIGLLGIGFGSPGNPHIISRYMSIKDPDQLRYSAVVGTIWNVVMAWGALFIGLAGRTYFPDITMLPGGDTEKICPILAQIHLHPILFGVVIASIFAAIMSTADSQLLVAASGVVRDIYEKVIKKGVSISQKKLVLYSRVVVLVLVVCALVLGMLAKQLVFWLVLFAWAGLGASLGPTSILALYSKKTTRAGIFTGVIVGTVTTIVWRYTPFLKAIVYELVPAFLLSALATYLVSMFTKAPDNVDELFTAMEK